MATKDMTQASAQKPTRDQVLGLDIATHCGFYSTHESGTWNFEESMRRNNNKQHKAFRDTLIDFITKYDIRQIVAEDVNVNNHFIDQRKLSEFRGILLEVCDTLDLPEPAFINVKVVKSWATGDGNADKATMIKFAKLRWKVECIDDNEADALHIWQYYIHKFHI